MMRALWAKLTGHKPAADTPDPSRADYDPERDPLVRQFKLQRRQAERGTRRIQRELQRNPIESTVFPDRPRTRPEGQ